MKVELHLHTARYSLCALNQPHEMMRGLVRHGYGAVFITEHDAVWPQDELDELREQFPRIRIFPGVELTLGNSHLLVLGTNDPGYLQSKSPALILAKARDEGHLTVLTHPFRWEKSDWILQFGILPDAVEYRTNNHDQAGGEKSLELARRLGLSLVNTGDTHSLDMMNRFWIETDDDLKSPDQIREIVAKGFYDNCLKDL